MLGVFGGGRAESFWKFASHIFFTPSWHGDSETMADFAIRGHLKLTWWMAGWHGSKPSQPFGPWGLKLHIINVMLVSVVWMGSRYVR